LFDVVLPLKALAEAKSRLAEVLTDRQRSELMLAMAQDVIAVLLAWHDCRSLTIIQGPGWPSVLPVASNLQVMREDELGGKGLNAKLTSGINALEGEQYAVVFGDLPGLNAEDLKALSAAYKTGLSVICPDSDKLGTNVLAFSDSDVPVFRFGSGSYRDYSRHIPRERYVALSRPGLGFDVDTPTGLYALLWGGKATMPVGPATQNWLLEARRQGVMWRDPLLAGVKQNAGALV